MNDRQKSKTPAEWFSSDSPIKTREEDLLGRSAFAEAVADAICQWRGRESLVLALYGAWGNGKSSLKNMVIEHLRTSSPDVLIADFNPWQLANRPALCEPFFDELGAALGKGDLGSQKSKKELLARLKRLSRRLQGTHDLMKAARDFIGFLLVAVGVTTIFAAIKSPAVTIILGVLLVLGGFISLATKIADGAIKIQEAGTEIGVQSLGEVKEEIASELKKLKAPILVVVDDLDRLTPSETFEVLQLVKANGDFPNVIYLLLCDRLLVERNIETALGGADGREYLHKIVQGAFDVPVVDLARVQHVLLQRLDSIISYQKISQPFSQERWAEIFISGLKVYFNTLRDVNRFISTVSFQFSALSARGALEVNPIDLIALEVLRLNEPNVYAALGSNKIALTDRTKAATFKSSVNSIVALAPQNRSEQVEAILNVLFPSSGEEDKLQRDLRICHLDLFDRYFRLGLSESELSQVTIHNLLEARKDRERLRTELEMLNSRGLLENAINQLSIHDDSLEQLQVEPLVTAIFDVSDLVPEQSGGGLFALPMLWQISSVIRSALMKLPEPYMRANTIANAISNSKGLSLPVQFVALVDEAKTPTHKLVLEDQMVNLKQIATQRIEHAAASGQLGQHRKLPELISLWRRWGGDENPSLYIEAMIKEPAGTLQLLKSLLVKSVSHSGYSSKVRTYMRSRDIEAVISIETLEARVQDIPFDNLHDEEKRALKAFRGAMERRKLGKSDDYLFSDDEYE